MVRVAGPALAWWLAARGFRPAVAERAPQLRGGGYAVDFRGAVHLSVLEQIRLLIRMQRLECASWTADALKRNRKTYVLGGRCSLFSNDALRAVTAATRPAGRGTPARRSRTCS